MTISFPSHLSRQDLYRCSNGEPNGTWFLQTNAKEVRIYVIEPKRGLNHYLIDDVITSPILFNFLRPDRQLFYDENVLKTKPVPVANAQSILKLFSPCSLSDKDSDFVKKQIQTTLLYLFDAAPKLRARAQKTKRGIYICPQMMGPNLKKIYRVKDKALYGAAHAHVTPSGKIDIIPKHPSLFLGSGTSKFVWAGVELTKNDLPNRITAFCRIKFSTKSELKSIRCEYRWIRGSSEKRKVEYTPRLSIHHRKARLVLPFANLGDLKQFRFTSDEVPQILMEAARCVEFFHRNQVILRDIKPENFLAHKDPTENIRVDMFDLAFADQVKVTDCYRGGSLLYFAPELYNFWVYERYRYDAFKTDIFALGLTLFETKTKELPDFYISLIDNYFPYENLDAMDYPLKMKQIQADYRHAWLKFTPSGPFEQLVKKMIHPIPFMRPSIQSVVKRLEQIFKDYAHVKKAIIKKGRLYLDRSEAPLNDEVSENHLFAFNQEGTLYVKKVLACFQNTLGILPKSEITAAGEIHLIHGAITAVSNKTEPYDFTNKVFLRGLRQLISQLPYSNEVIINQVSNGQYNPDLRPLEEIIDS